MDKQQTIQDSQYTFPYHYIPSSEPFSLVKFWSYGINYLATVKLLAKLIRALPGNSILDVGAGEGRLVFELSKEFPEKKVAGIDYSNRAIGLAKALNPGLQMTVLNILEEPITERYDCYTLIEVFEHIPVQEATNFASALAKAVPAGAHLIITVPHRNIKVSQKHAQHFTVDSLFEYYKESFEKVNVVYLHRRHGFLRRIFNKIIANRFFILNHTGLLKKMFAYFSKEFFISPTEAECERILVVLRRK